MAFTVTPVSVRVRFISPDCASATPLPPVVSAGRGRRLTQSAALRFQGKRKEAVFRVRTQLMNNVLRLLRPVAGDLTRAVGRGRGEETAFEEVPPGSARCGWPDRGGSIRRRSRRTWSFRALRRGAPSGHPPESAGPDSLPPRTDRP